MLSFVFLLLEAGTGAAIVFLTGRQWEQNAGSPLVRLAGNRRHFIFACEFAILPTLVAWIRWSLQMLNHYDGMEPAQMLVSAVIAIFSGACFGLAAVCCASPAGGAGAFRWKSAFGVLAALILIPMATPFSSRMFFGVFHIFVILLILAVAKILIGDTPAARADSSRSREGSSRRGQPPPALLALSVSAGAAALAARPASTAPPVRAATAIISRRVIMFELVGKRS